MPRQLCVLHPPTSYLGAQRTVPNEGQMAQYEAAVILAGVRALCHGHSAAQMALEVSIECEWGSFRPKETERNFLAVSNSKTECLD